MILEVHNHSPRFKAWADGFVRVSVGLETLKDVIADLEQALS
ncbi:PLP-dependent transferase [Flavobacterium sp. LS2P90]|uniref:PLP-dependent transferase n=1 Tax=Flavobacterium xylosi TaxID=3230415 RepID=A0ABW6HVP7_9FLAO